MKSTEGAYILVTGRDSKQDDTVKAQMKARQIKQVKEDGSTQMGLA